MKHASSDKTTESYKNAQLSIMINLTNEMTYATLNQNSNVQKSTGNEENFQNTVSLETVAAYATVNLEHSIEDNYKQSN